MTENFRPFAPAEPVGCTLPAVALPRRSIPSVAGLIAFEATARHLSFSQAARDLALSQGAVSKRVRQLEDVLGVALLIRSRHQVRLTETGRRYLKDVRGVLAQIESSTQALVARGKSHSTLTLGLPRAVATYWLMPRLAAFHVQNPGVEVSLVITGGAADLRWDGLDAAIVQVPVGGQGLSLFDEVLVPVAAPSIAAGLIAAGPTGLTQAPLLHFARRADLWWRWFEHGGTPLAGPLGGPSHDSLALVLDAALLGHGVALAPLQLTTTEIGAGRLIRLSDNVMPTGQAYVLRLAAGRDGDATLGRFAHWLGKSIGAVPRR